MQVVLVRHGEAVPYHLARTDGERWLTEHGRASVRRVAATLGREGVMPDVIYTSPLVRAVQTTELLLAGFSRHDVATVWGPLAGGTTAQALAALDEHSADASVMLVGHEPLISAMTGFVLGHPVGDFAPGTAWVVNTDTRVGFFVDPETGARRRIGE